MSKKPTIEERTLNLIENKEEAFKNGYASLDEDEVSRIIDSLVYIVETQSKAIEDLQYKLKDLREDYDNHMNKYKHDYSDYY